jgi:transcriptional regulator with XRE-family HTH domain
MAAALGITPPSLSSLESNNSGVSLNVFRNLVRIYRANPYWLLFGDGEIVNDSAGAAAHDPPDFTARLADIQKQVDDLRRQLDQR